MITEGFPGADLDNLVIEAAMEAMTKAGLDNVETVAKTDFKFILRKFNAEFINKNTKLSKKLLSFSLAFIEPNKKFVKKSQQFHWCFYLFIFFLKLLGICLTYCSFKILRIFIIICFDCRRFH